MMCECEIHALHDTMHVGGSAMDPSPTTTHPRVAAEERRAAMALWWCLLREERAQRTVQHPATITHSLRSAALCGHFLCTPLAGTLPPPP